MSRQNTPVPAPSETTERSPWPAQALYQAAWPDMLANLQTAYAELSRAQFELQRQAADTAAARDLLERVIEAMSEALFLADRTGTIIRSNAAAGRLLDCAAADLRGRRLSEVCGSDAIPASAWALLERAPAGEIKDFEVRIRTLEGREVVANVSCTVVREPSGKITGLLVVARDVTERRHAQDAIERLNRELRRRAEDLAAANRELEAFSYSVSHDLRAPLRAMDGFSRKLLEDHAGGLPADARHYLRRVRANAQRMGALIDDLLQFSRLHQTALRRKRVAPADLVRWALRDLEDEMRGRACEIRVGELPDCLADPALLQLVFANLLGNALKFTRRRPVAVVEVGGQPGPDGPVYVVRDNGVGFDMRFADQLFRVFHRLHRAEEYEGTGVGLAIVQRIVHRHGGRVWADATPDGGAAFHFTVPRGDGDEPGAG